jgi:hypothetical protein
VVQTCCKVSTLLVALPWEVMSHIFIESSAVACIVSNRQMMLSCSSFHTSQQHIVCAFVACIAALDSPTMLHWQTFQN